MGLWHRLDAMDRRFLERRNRRYDKPQPQWVALSPLVSAPLTFVILMARDSGWWIVLFVLAATAWCVYFVAVFRWSQRHRLPKQPEFPISVDRTR